MADNVIRIAPGPSEDQQVFAALQTKYGAVDYSRWQVNRYPFWSFQQYLTGGAASFTFFGQAIGQAVGVTQQITNLTKSGSLGQLNFLWKAIGCGFFIPAEKASSTVFTDDTYTLSSDIINGLFQAGVLRVQINGKDWYELAKPFLFAPYIAGQGELRHSGLEAQTGSLTALRTAWPDVKLNSRAKTFKAIDPQIFLMAEQSFTVRIDFPAGALAYIASNVVNDTTNPLYIGVGLDGIAYIPQ